ncbi:DNA repair protein RadA [Nostocoides jenkinsii]|uniref:DNA repair protein RadA n=1 Tax=Nostocoides jenkinsii Ben 74 TaxID=1193518 RepID=A0A077MBR9_9MICO|nr:DNA repair protein RadA [Tetrasphaera jenkinsii]CCI54054.1 DNA repair protein; 6-O-methylguanine-DNA methyltransferase [Tetrasphaera jenkinsii Ben 74]
MATKTARPGYRCSECGWTTPKWVGRCGECQAWGAVAEAGGIGIRTKAAASVARPAVPIATVDVRRAVARATGVAEFDRVLGGGLVPGSVVLIAGEPGIGKSTLLLDVAARAARSGATALYVSGEESAAQVRARAERIEAIADTLYLAAETDLATVLAHIDQVSPQVMVIDSVQTIASSEIDGSAGNVSQVREVAAAVIAAAKSRDISVLLVGHVTKEGSIAGPRLLEHLVDVVVTFEGERHSRLRLVRAVKNRFGPTDEVGCFDLSDIGIVGLPDPSGLFLSQRTGQVAGTAITVTLEGRRPLVAEVQALVNESVLPTPRRATHGLDSSRVSLLLAVLETRAKVRAGKADIYVSTVGGVRLREPAVDLALTIAIASAIADQPLDARTVVIGEVGLAGEVRSVPGLPRRLSEAARLAFTRAIVPVGTTGAGPVPLGIEIIEVADVPAALRAMMTRPARGEAG